MSKRNALEPIKVGRRSQGIGKIKANAKHDQVIWGQIKRL